MKYLIVLVNITFLLSLIFFFNFAIFFQVFEHYLSMLLGEDVSLKAFYYGITFFPVLLIVSNIASWILYAYQKYRAALIVALIPLIPIIIFLIVLNIK